ncbi:probable RNA-directed DNA polymerase from transposon BS isoform X1 [Anthonomus grandis grandis]|uniref:probable RNA-directed DNA polymerase from transposon BS isoform X1 n=1 Tax=Anthonomus grandis grandis TaxID=2921223 RepID=UPI0021659E93|nr:probable RNA-directed DNA polymerase from transposon BS isoform X1 [Anthonomus grandis grandis]
MVALNNFCFVNEISPASATRVSQSRTIIDHVICTTNKKNECDISVEDTSLSDHRKICLEISANIRKFKPGIFVQRPVLNIQKFKQKLQDKLIEENIDSFQNLINVISNCKIKSTINKKIKCRQNNDWITPDLLILIKEKELAYKKYKKAPENNNFKLNFTRLKNSLNNKIKALKNAYFKNKWAQAAQNTRKQWDTINLFLNNNSTKSNINQIEINGLLENDDKKIADSLNKYFTEVGATIIEDMRTDTKNILKQDFKEIKCDNSIFFEPTDSNEISNIILSLKRNAAPGHDKITILDLTNIKEYILNILVILINNAFNIGEFPPDLKISKVCPIHKYGPKTQLNNYRPISIISVFSKIIETVIKRRMMSFIEKYISYDLYQYGFLKNSSTLSATIDLLNYVSANLDQGKIVIAVFVDLRKAFDVVNHDILLNKLEEMGFRGSALSLIGSYLLNRRQYVHVNNKESNILTFNCGVPQGSVLGPLLYSLYVLSLWVAGLDAQYYTFADDTVLLYSDNDCDRLVNRVNDDLTKYSQWLLQNNLKINLDKTKYILFKQKNKTINQVRICLNGATLENVNNIKYLGLTLDENLNWNAHIDYLKSKIILFTGAFYKCKHFLSNAAKYKIYNAYFLSNLRYLIPVWGTCCKYNFQRVEILQSKVLKILFNLDYFMHAGDIFEILKIHSISHILKIEQAKLIFKIINKLQKSNYTIVYSSEIHAHNLRNNNIRLSSARTNIALRNPINAATQTYNDLSYEIKQEVSYYKFIRMVKQSLHY